MIVFDLRCAPAAHVFEAWFGSSADYDDQRERGLVSCPICGSLDVGKAPMAPTVPPKGKAGMESHFSAPPEQMKAMLAAAAAVQKQLLAGSESVGDRFADEARAIHFGDVPARLIHGRATLEQANSLIEDGISIAPLPFPVAEPSEEN